MKNVKWSPDSKMLLVSGYDERREPEEDYSGGIFSIDVSSGKVSDLLAFSKSEEKDGEIASWARTKVEWSEDQKYIYYKKDDQIINRELATGKEKILLKNQKVISSMNLSADGKKLLFCTENHIYIQPTIGGELIPIVEVKIKSSGISISNNAIWSPDGNYIFFTENTDDGSFLWQISAEGKNKKEVWHSKIPINSVSVHPDGKRIVITMLNQESEIWRVDNLLSNEDDEDK